MTPENSLARLREICLGYPEAQEGGGVGNPSFKVRGKIFAMRHSLHGAARWSVWFKAPPGMQQLVVGDDPARFFVPPYVGHKGWVGMRLDGRVGWREVAFLVERSWRRTAPKRLLQGKA